MTGQELAAEADYQAMLDDDAAAHAEMLAENEMAEAAYQDFRRRNADDEIYVCTVCGLISPMCQCDLTVERKVNERYPWPADLNALSITEAAELCAARGKFRREQRMGMAAVLVAVMFASFACGLWAASSIIGDHVKQELQSADRIR